MLILLWIAEEKPSSLEYAVESEEPNAPGLRWDEQVLKHLTSTIGEYVTGTTKDLLVEYLSNHHFLAPQLEPLRMGLRFVWKLADVSFVNKSESSSSERTGGIRKPKKLSFTTQLDLLELSFGKEVLTKFAIKWAFEGSDEIELISPNSIEVDTRINNWISLQADSCVFTLRGSAQDKELYDQSSLYSYLLENGEFKLPKVDQMGPTRALKAAWQGGLNPFIRLKSGALRLSTDYDQNTISRYSDRLKLTNKILSDVYSTRFYKQQFDNIYETKTIEELTTIMDEPIDLRGFAHNRILSGAPGTGKSFKLKNDAELLGAKTVRTVFFSGLRHSSFFGTLRPTVNDDGSVSYGFEPGPFIDAYVEAYKAPNEVVVLIIEEMNRADVSEVFGPVFQLLDRDQNGVSEYPVSVSRDCSRYLAHALAPAEIPDTLTLPNNLLIWSTINPADQSVTNLDSAFLRRWSREYIHIDDAEESNNSLLLDLKFIGEKILWNDLRKALNGYMQEIEPNLSEDKLLGPFFITQRDVESQGSEHLFIHKIMNYLVNDSLRYRKSELFDGMSIKNFSDFLKRYEYNENFKNWLNRLTGLLD